MDATSLCPAPAELGLDRLIVTRDGITVVATARRADAACPACGAPSHWVHRVGAPDSADERQRLHVALRVRRRPSLARDRGERARPARLHLEVSTVAGWKSHHLYVKGREHDGHAGLVDMRARWYDPELRRFISEDPLGLAGGINPYVFAGNDPINNADPYGLRPCGDNLLLSRASADVPVLRRTRTAADHCYGAATRPPRRRTRRDGRKRRGM